MPTLTDCGTPVYPGRLKLSPNSMACSGGAGALPVRLGKRLAVEA